MNDTRGVVIVDKSRVIQVSLTQEEADVYFDSDWYKEQVKAKRNKLIEQGLVKVGGWHENNPEHLAALWPKPSVIGVTSPSIIVRARTD